MSLEQFYLIALIITRVDADFLSLSKAKMTARMDQILEDAIKV